MANTKLENLGKLITNFMLNDMTAYIINTTGTGGYASTDWAEIGYTSPDKEITPIQEQYVREDGIPRTTTYEKTIRLGLEMSFGLSNQTADFAALVSNGTITTDTTSTTGGTRIAHGTTQAAKEYRALRLVCERDDGVNYAITIPKASITLNGAKTYGGEEEVVTPLMIKAIYNPLADNTANLYYENYFNTGVSPTADIPPSFN